MNGISTQAARSSVAQAMRPSVSIVSTMYRSSDFLERFLSECLEALASIGCDDYEIVLVNDGSPDNSLQLALERRRDIPRLVVVDLSRNFGHHHAMLAGLRHAQGDQVFLIDCDLEVSPLTLRDFHGKLLATGADLVFGYQATRKGGLFERVSGVVFWRGFNLLSDVKVPENMLTERLMTRRYVDALLTLGDQNLFLGGMMSWTGFPQVGLQVNKRQRDGSSTYTLLRRVRLMVDAVSSFSSKPLVWLFNMGIMITSISFLYAAYLVFRKLAFGDTLVGFTSIMALMALTLGILTTGLGLIGIYLGRVFTQVQARPTFIVKDIYR